MDTTARRYSIVLGQRMSWPDLLARARETESLGFDGLFLVDHFYGLFDLDQPTHEAYTMLAAVAPFTQSIRLGVMVAGNTYRNPAFLLKQAITVDHISGGRVDFGVGAGWVEREHEAYGFDFPVGQGAGRSLRRSPRDLGLPPAQAANDLRRRPLPAPRRPVPAEIAPAGRPAGPDRRLRTTHDAADRPPRRYLERHRHARTSRPVEPAHSTRPAPPRAATPPP